MKTLKKINFLKKNKKYNKTIKGGHKDNTTIININPLSIKIDDFTFIIENKFIGDRIKIYYKVNGVSYFTYKSNSDVNWRFGICYGKFGYFKGIDYMTTTQIHQSLQCFINKIYDKIPLLENEETNNETNNISKKPEEILIPVEDLLKMTKSKKKTTKTRKISSRLFKKEEHRERDTEIFQNDVFIPMSIICKSGSCFKQSKQYKQSEQPYIKKIFEKDYHFSESIYDNQNYNFTTKYFLYMNNLLKKQTISDKQDINTYYNLIVSIYSKYMEYFFKLCDTVNSQFICNVNINVPYDEKSVLEQKLIVSIYKINIELKDDLTKKFTLIYGTYDYKHYNNITKTIEEEKKSYKIILNLIPFDTKINKFGLYENYISSGIYVYKMFDYTSLQVEYNHKLPGDYTFIGDLLTNMWPLQILKEPSLKLKCLF